MKKMTWKMRLLGGLVAVSMLFAGCAQGADCDETFQSTVTNTQLESPDASSIAFALVTNAAGVEQVKASWPLSKGAGGYEVSIANVNDVNNPEYLLQNEVVDGTSVTFSLFEDTNYEISVRTLGNASFNNKDAETASVVTYSTMIGGQAIPDGSEIGKFITDWMVAHLDEYKAAIAADSNFEFAFDLAAGGNYTLDTPAEFGPIPVRLRGVQGNRPVVVVGEAAALNPSNGLKIKNVNFDCTKMKGDVGARGLISMQVDPEESVIGVQTYYCQKPIRMEACWVKELPISILNIDKCAWGLEEFRITDCIIQFNNRLDTEWKTAINAWQNVGRLSGVDGKCWYGGISNTFIANSTLYNIWPSETIKDKGYFLRFANSDISKWSGSTAGQFEIKNSTIVRLSPRKQFGNNMGKTNQYTNRFVNSIFWDCWRLNKVKNGSSVQVMENNTIWGVFQATNGDASYAKEENPGFTDDNIFKVLDFTQPNGGVNFTPTTGNGDPRWLK